MGARGHVDGISRQLLLILAFVAAVGAALFVGMQSNRPESAQAQGRAGGKQPIVIYMSPLDGRRSAICLVDAERNRLAIYQMDFGRQRLKLVAVRDFTADLGLDDYNNEAPLPKDIRAWLEGKKEK